MDEHVIPLLAGIGLIAILCQWLAWWAKIPAILFLLAAGLLAGPVTGWLDPDALFGPLLFPFVSLSVAVILFEGSLTLKLRDLAGIETVVRNLISVGLLITWLITTLSALWLLDFPWDLALLFGALTVVTGPTVIVPMLRTVRPTQRIANVLRWEGILIDPVGALLAVLVFEFIVSGRGGQALGHTLATFAESIATGVAFGVLGGYGLGQALRRRWLPEYLHNVATLAVVFVLFAGSNQLVHESGLLTVTVMGMWLANMKGVPLEDILDFKESLSILLISALFIILAARVEFSEFAALGWGGAGVFLAIQFLARPLKVAASSWGSDLSWRERSLLAWIAPRGIVAAAVSALFAIKLQGQGMEQAAMLVPLTMIVIVGTVVLQSTTSRGLACALGVAEPEPRGWLLVGANLVAREIAAALHKNGFRVLLSDDNWDRVRKARMQGLPTYYGNPVSEHADRSLDLVGLGGLLALSPRHELNALAGLRYRPEFGSEAVYELQGQREAEKGEKHRLSRGDRAQILFGRDVTYADLVRRLREGGKISSTLLTDSFDFHSYQAMHRGKAIVLFALTPRGRLRVFTPAGQISPESGWTVIGLLPPEQPPRSRADSET